ncbi:MAG: response regulator [Pseudomonadota bacterium]
MIASSPSSNEQPGAGRGRSLLEDLRVLIVEDEFLVAALLEDTLSAFGCRVIGPASTVEEGLELIGSERIEAAVLDVNIDGVPVFPVADALAAKGVPFIFATGYGRAGVAQRHGERNILEKPYESRSLRHALESAVRGRRD